MKKIEVTGKTVDEAVMEACIQLGISSDRLAYEVLEQGSAGILGLFAKPAKISAWKKSDEELAEDRRHQEASKKAEEIGPETCSRVFCTCRKRKKFLRTGKEKGKSYSAGSEEIGSCTEDKD